MSVTSRYSPPRARQRGGTGQEQCGSAGNSAAAPHLDKRHFPVQAASLVPVAGSKRGICTDGKNVLRIAVTLGPEERARIVEPDSEASVASGVERQKLAVEPDRADVKAA